MTRLLTILLLFSGGYNLPTAGPTVTVHNVYVDTTGNDGNAGTIGAPVKTIARANALFAGMAAGDTMFFRAGQTFKGNLVIGISGAIGTPVVITSYGTGAKPLFSGLTTLTGWSNVSGNIYQSTPAVTIKPLVNILTIDGTAVDLGRTPNANVPWLVYRGSTTTSLTSSSLYGGPDYTGAEVVTKRNSYTISRGLISSQQDSTINFTVRTGIDNNNPLSPSPGKTGFGYFIQRDARTLDVHGEWFYNTGTNKMQVYLSANPSTYLIRTSYIDTLITVEQKNNITISGLAFEGAGMYAICSHLGSNLVVTNCTFNNNTRAIYAWNTSNTIAVGNTIDNSLNNAISVINRQSKTASIKDNVIRNTGKLVGVGTFPTNSNFKAIVSETPDTAKFTSTLDIINNTVLYTGYMGIEFKGNNVTVKNNHVGFFDSTLDDGGGIYSFSSIPATTTHRINQNVVNNTVHDAIGAWMGTNRVSTSTPDVAGIYYDEQVEGVNTISNTVYNIPGNGIQMNAPLNMVITNNNIWNCDFTIQLAKKAIREMSGIDIKHNTFYQKTATQVNFWHFNEDTTKPTSLSNAQSLQLWNMDSNYITNLATNSYKYSYFNGTANKFPANFPLATWRLSYLHDVHSSLPPLPVTSSNTRLVSNPGSTPLFYAFPGLRKMGVDGTIYDDAVNIPPYSSLFLIDDGNSPVSNVAPVANAGANINITLPTNSVNLSGSGSDVDGTVITVAWLRVLGSGGTITSPSSASTTVTGLTQGTYQYEFTVFDNNGASGKDTVQVVVNAAPNTPPTANAGVDKNITLPVSSVSATGVATDAEGPTTVLWTQVGTTPAVATIGSATTLTPTFSGLVEGTYTFAFTVKDASNVTATDNMSVVVNAAIPPPNIAPTANADVNRTFTLPTSSTTLNGTAADIDGTVNSVFWTKVSGPAGPTIGSPSSLTTVINGFTTPGTYLYRLTATDNGGLTGFGEVTIIVNPAPNVAPTVDAGVNRIITLPQDTVKVIAVGSDVDGTITYSWSQVAGPGSVTFSASTSATTFISGLIPGIYKIRVTVTDNVGATAFDEMDIVVNSAPIINTVPTVTAGIDQEITLPVSSVTLTAVGASTTLGAVIRSYSWVIAVNGGSAILGSPTTATTTLDNLTPGDYDVDVTVTDSNGLTATDRVHVKVNAAPVLGYFILKDWK